MLRTLFSSEIFRLSGLTPGTSAVMRRASGSSKMSTGGTHAAPALSRYCQSKLLSASPKRRLIRRSRLDTSTAGSLKVRVGRNICTPPSKRKRDRSSSFTLRRPPEQSACRFPAGLACRDDTRSAALADALPLWQVPDGRTGGQPDRLLYCLPVQRSARPPAPGVCCRVGKAYLSAREDPNGVALGGKI